ncbi:thioesterase superfamily protein, partial [Botrytis cinerea]
GWGHDLLPSLSLSTDPEHHKENVTTFIFKPTVHHCNANSTVHGGCIATVFDACTSVALMGRYSAQKWGGGGVSRGLGCTYLKGITIHDESEGEEGKNDVLVDHSPPIHFPIPLSNPKTNTPTPSPATMKRRTGEVLAICEHSKVNIVGVELPGSKEKGREGKESKL